MATQSSGVIISVYNEKGGSGKTTTACQLAGTLGLRGYDVAVVDLDRQETSSSWIAREGGKYFKGQVWPGHRYGALVADELISLASKYDVIVVDCAPSVENPSTWGALLSSHLALIPSKLNAQDIAALPAAKKLARKAWEALGEKFPVRVLANAVRLHFKDDKAALAGLYKDSEVPPLKTTLGDRKAYSRAFHIGSTAHMIPNSEDAVKEIEGLADEVLRLVNLSAKKGARK